MGDCTASMTGSFLGAQGEGDRQLISDLIPVLIGLELRYGELDSLLIHSQTSEAKARELADLLRKLQQLVAKIGRIVASVDRLLPRLLVAVGSEPAGRSGAFRAELLRLWNRPGASIPEWQQLARSIPAGAKLNMASTADRVATRFPFLLQEYRLHQQAR